jgi:hypothetical protein
MFEKKYPLKCFLIFKSLSIKIFYIYDPYCKNYELFIIRCAENGHNFFWHFMRTGSAYRFHSYFETSE